MNTRFFRSLIALKNFSNKQSKKRLSAPTSRLVRVVPAVVGAVLHQLVPHAPPVGALELQCGALTWMDKRKKLISDFQHNIWFFLIRKYLRLSLFMNLEQTNNLSPGKKNRKRRMFSSLDFSKPFDTVNHTKLLQAVSNSTLPLTYVRWLVVYLRGLSAACKHNDTTSVCNALRTGVPQGTAISPLLFK